MYSHYFFFSSHTKNQLVESDPVFLDPLEYALKYTITLLFPAYFTAQECDMQRVIDITIRTLPPLHFKFRCVHEVNEVLQFKLNING